MHNNGFLVRITVNVIDHRDPSKSPVRPRKSQIELEVLPGEDLLTKLPDGMKDATARVVKDLTNSPMLARAKEVAAPVSEGPKPGEPCPECKIVPPGHKIDCKTGNEKAQRYQDQLEDDHRRKQRGKRTQKP